MKPSEKRRLRQERDAARREADNLERRASSHTGFVRDRLLSEANRHRETQSICEMYVKKR